MTTARRSRRLRIAHLADLHLGFRQFGRIAPDGMNQRETDVASAFQRAVDQVIAAAPDLVLIGGDVFHSLRPPNRAIISTFIEFERLRASCPTTQIVLVSGNHDTPRTAETGHILRLFERLGIHVAITPRWMTFPELDVAVFGLPESDAGAAALEAGWQSRPPSPDRYVLLAHGEVTGLFAFDRAEWSHNTLDPQNFSRWEYVALGHYHVAKQVAPNAWYSGSLDYVSSNPWGELQEERELGPERKGWLLATLDDDAAPDVAFQPAPLGRRFLDLPIVEGQDLDAAAITAAALQALAQAPIAGAVVRLVVRDVPRLVGREVDHRTVRAAAAAALHFQFELRRPVASIRVAAPVIGEHHEPLTVPEIIDRYLSRRDLPPDVDREQLRSLSRELMAEAERQRQEQVA